jgi:ABC-type sugar transport system ATPase subunit
MGAESGVRQVVSAPRLVATGIDKRFGGVRALAGAQLTIAPGSIHALVGENGAGKSTMIRILAGAIRADAGRIEIDGREARISDAYAARALGIAVVHQELSLAPDLSVAENVFLGRWPRDRFGLVDRAALARDTRRALESLGVAIAPDAPVRGLSVALCQQVEIARALSQDARLLVLDEPSAVLSPHELATLFRILRGLRDRGVAILYVSHRLDEIFELANAVTVLRDGRHVSTRAIAEVTREGLIAEMVGRAVGETYPPPLAAAGDVILRVERLSAAPRFRDVSFGVRAGEVFALSGMVGSGRSSVLQTIFGAVRASGGRVIVGDTVGPFATPRAAIEAGIASLPEDRKRSGLMLERGVRENLSLASLEAVGRGGMIDPARERSLVERMRSDLAVKARSIEDPARTLSGGNQQKVMLGRWMTRPYRVLLLDEPTRGVDVGARQEIYTHIRRIAAAGTAVVMASSELGEVIGMGDRIGVMRRGRLAAIVDNHAHDARQEDLLRLAAADETAPTHESALQR